MISKTHPEIINNWHLIAGKVWQKVVAFNPDINECAAQQYKLSCGLWVSVSYFEDNNIVSEEFPYKWPGN